MVLLFVALLVLNIFVSPFNETGIYSDLVYDVAMLAMTIIFFIVDSHFKVDYHRFEFWELLKTSAVIFIFIRLVKIYILGYIYNVDKDLLQYMNPLYITSVVIICWSIFTELKSLGVKINKSHIALIILVSLGFAAGTWYLLRSSMVVNGVSFITILSCSVIALLGSIIIIAGLILLMKMMGGRLQKVMLLLFIGFIFMIISQFLYIGDSISGLGTAVNSAFTLGSYYVFCALCSLGGLVRLDLISKDDNAGKSNLK